MEVWQAILLGIIQGLTEFLPVSSSGHILLGSALLGVKPSDNLLFTVALHGATVLSTIAALWPEIWRLLQGFFRFRWNAETRYALLLAVSMIPIALVGLLFKETVERLFADSLLLVGGMLLLTALLLSLTHLAGHRTGSRPGALSALIMGIGQAFAVLPGLSRSGTTISLGLLAGVEKREAAQFSFLMVLPPIIGMNLLDLLSGNFASTEIPASSLVAGFLAAFVTGYAACRWMLSVVRRGKLYWFALYCALVGALAIIFSLI